MESIRIVVIGGPEAKARMAAAPARLNRAMRIAMQKSIDRVQNRIALNLTGAVLHVKTGRLRQSWLQPAAISADGMTGRFGSNVEYAAAHEYGFVGAESVRPYVRRVTQVFGRKVRPGVFAYIPGFTRRQHIPARPYARPALRESIAEINEIFRAGLAAEMSRL